MTIWEKQDIEAIAKLPYNWGKIKNKVILISGGTGFLGTFISNVIRYRNEMFGDNTKIISLSRSGGISDQTVEYMKVDISVPFIFDEKVDYVIHLASNTHPKQYAEDPIGTIITNIYGCNSLLNIAKEQNARFLLASSVEIYGQGSKEPMPEEYSGYIDCNQARSGYNEAKRVCEALCQSYRQQYSVECVIARLSRIFGADIKSDTKAMSQFMDKAIERNNIILKSKGNQKYSYCYIADAASAIIKLMLDGVDGEAYNVAADHDNLSLGEYAEYIASLAEKKVVYNIVDDSSVSKATYALLDCTKLKSLGWSPLYTIKEGLERTYEIKRKRLLG